MDRLVSLARKESKRGGMLPKPVQRDSPRLQWMAARVAAGTGASVEAASTFLLGSDTVRAFLEGDSDTKKLIVTFQRPFAPEDDDGLPTTASEDGKGEEEVEGKESDSSGGPVLALTNGTDASHPVRGKAVFFLRCTDSDHAVNQSKEVDGEVLTGELEADLLGSLHGQLGLVFRDALRQRSDWGRAGPSQVSELLDSLSEVEGAFEQTRRSIAAGSVRLTKPRTDLNFDKMLRDPVAVARKRPELIKELEATVATWADEIQVFLEDDTSSDRVVTDRVGPRGVIEWWRGRMQALASIMEQLKAKPRQDLLAFITSLVSQRAQGATAKKGGRGASAGGGAGRPDSSAAARASDESTFAVLRRWRAVDIALTEAANEAKDNSKYLATLEKFVDPLYKLTPPEIVDALPALLNSIKMIHTVSRYLSNDEKEGHARMMSLFQRITEQMIRRCCEYLVCAGSDEESGSGEEGEKGGRIVVAKRSAATGIVRSMPESGTIDLAAEAQGLWDKDPQMLIRALRHCLRLNDAYQTNYRLTKEALASTRGVRQFDWPDQPVFSRFDLFCRRAIKLIDLFSTRHQFDALQEGGVEGLEDITARFGKLMTDLRKKKHDLLAFSDNAFDREYVEFTARVADIERDLRTFIDEAFARAPDVLRSLALLRKFRTVLQREKLRHDLDEKFEAIFRDYGDELDAVRELYDAHSTDPPIPRNLPPVAGNITWARYLLHRIEAPMRAFEEHQAVLASRDAKRIVRRYNKIASTLVSFEYLWHKAWVESIEAAKAGLQATLIIRHPDDGRLYVNFDPQILQLIREAKCLDRMGIAIPEAARVVLLQEERFKRDYNDLSHQLREFDRILRTVIPITADVLRAAVQNLEYRLRPGMVTLTWTSMNIEQFKASVAEGLLQLEELVRNVNDIIENRVEKNLKVISRTLLVDLPEDGRIHPLDDFVATQELTTHSRLPLLQGKSIEVQAAIKDMLYLVESYPIDPHVPPPSSPALQRLRDHYNHFLYAAILNATKTSLNSLKNRVSIRREGTLRPGEEEEDGEGDEWGEDVGDEEEGGDAPGSPSAVARARRSGDGEGHPGVKASSRPSSPMPQALSGDDVAEASGKARRQTERLTKESREAVLLFGQSWEVDEEEESKAKKKKAAGERGEEEAEIGQMSQSDMAALLSYMPSIDHVLELSILGSQDDNVRPFFEVGVQLAAPSVQLRPTLESIQQAINTTARAVLRVSRQLPDWSVIPDERSIVEAITSPARSQHGGGDASPPRFGFDSTRRGLGKEEPSPWLQLGDEEEETGGIEDILESNKSFFDRITKDIELVRVVLLLAGSVQSLREQVDEYLHCFRRFQWLWKRDADAEYEAFLATNPTINDYDRQLQTFHLVELEISRIAPRRRIGALCLTTKKIKTQLIKEIRRWMARYTERVHERARNALTSLHEYIKTTRGQLVSREVDSLAALSFIMELLREVRHRQSGIHGEIEPILDMYSMLQRYGTTIPQEESDLQSVIWTRWKGLVDTAASVTERISGLQAGFRTQLLSDTKKFRADVARFRRNFERAGPMEDGITPTEGMERLKHSEDEFEMMDRKREMYQNGERLFALPVTEYPELERTKKELSLLGRLYGLYKDVMQTVDSWKQILWTKVVAEIGNMQTEMEGFQTRCRKLPGRLREWKAYGDLNEAIEGYMVLLPLLAELSKPSIRDRHWEKVRAIVGRDEESLDVDDPEFRLSDLLACPLVENNDEIIEVTDGADKELSLEEKLKEQVEYWQDRDFAFQPWKDRGVEVLIGEKGVIEELEESQMNLQTMLTSRHIWPFKTEAQEKLTELSDASETLALWGQVQQTWCSLESVFLGGDIAKQMPMVAKKFQKVDKEFVNLMIKAKDDLNVLKATSNEILRSSLPHMNDELQVCQNKLEKYLEQKRSKFPRFYFVSDPVLLQILSKGSDLTAIQQYYQNVFAAVNLVTYDTKDPSLIVRLRSLFKGSWEEVDMDKSVKAQGNIEDWLNVMLDEMKRTMKIICADMAGEVAVLGPEGAAIAGTGGPGTGPLRSFVDANLAQYALLGIQFLWTSDTESALSRLRSDRNAMSESAKRSDAIAKIMSSWCLTDLGSKMNRTKIETLITIQVHQKDVSDTLARLAKGRRIRSSNDFEWLKQARFGWDPDGSDEVNDEGTALISVTDIDFNYQYEFLGTKERLVITPLTDRCYISLAQAFGMCMGGAPAGPAGTGKTETVKDLGTTLGIFVIVTNCSDQMRYTDCAKIFKGLCQSGLWGCFDEFNRITLPVLSVVAQQVQSINDAKRAQVSDFTFLGEPGVRLNPVVYFAITMNPGYAGRQELPENLKALFRTVAMMVPDREIIIKVKLCSVGYENFEALSKKFYICYTLCEQQLSKQRHYDFGLRNILSVLRTAGATKRNNLDKLEEELLYQTLRDMNLSKMVAQDVPLFESMLVDLFPKLTKPAKQTFPDVEEKLLEVAAEEGLVPHPSWVLKVLQFHATCLVRHGIMLTGPTGGGKTCISKCLNESLARVLDMKHREVRLNPKAVAAEDLFGAYDLRSGEWVKGIFASLWERLNDANSPIITWIIADGPVDTLWIESLNTVLDDNRILTLSNGDRFPMTDNTKIMFENETLKNASPATVSRAGIIYVSETDLDWKPIIEAWILKQPESRKEIFTNLFATILGDCSPEDPGHLFRHLTRELSPVMTLSRVGATRGCLNLLDIMLERSKGAHKEVGLERACERCLLFALSWSIGGVLETEDRKLFDAFLRSVSSEMPPIPDGQDLTIYEFMLEPLSLKWQKWMPAVWDYPTEQEPLQFSTLLVPTMDSTRSMYILEALHNANVPVMMIGGPGTAKTSTALMFTTTFDPSKRILKRVNFSSVTTQRMLQDSVESSVDKRGGRAFGPPAGKVMTMFIDDISMPEINEWGDQPTNEMTRQLIEMGGLYFLDKDKRGDFKELKDITYMAAMVHPGGGRNDVPARLKRQFFVFNLVLPAIGSINDLYGQMISGRFNEDEGLFSGDAIDVSKHLTEATIRLWNQVKAKMLPTPAKFHYIFNMRDLSRVFQGILLSPRETITKGGVVNPCADQGVNLIRLWRHECARVFEDKLTNNDDKKWFRVALDDVTAHIFGDDMAEGVYELSCAETPAPGYKGEDFFVDFFRDDVYDEDEVLVDLAPKMYEPGGSLDSVRDRVTQFMQTYNKENPATPLNLVLFEDALRHLIRISRIIQMPRGSALLVGVGGSGKQSLTRLSAFIARHFLFQITLTKTYNTASLLEDLKTVYEVAGHQRKPVTFILTDAEIKSEDFLEYANTLLMTGEIAGLFPKDEMMAMTADLVPAFLKERPGLLESQDNLTQYFIDIARDNLHLVLCMSPVNPKFPIRARKFPGLINATTIDWFLPWPEEALVAVSRGLLGDFEVDTSAEAKAALIEHVGNVHSMVVDVCEEYYTAMRRRVYQTPKSFLSFLGNYRKFYSKKLKEIGTKEEKVNRGLSKLIQGAEDVKKLKGEIAEENKKVMAATVAVNKLLGELKVDQAAAEKKSKEVAAIADKCRSEADRIAGEKAACEEDLAKAQPIVDAANEALSKIKGDDITFIKAMKKPSDIIRLVMDGVLLLLFRPIDVVSPSSLNISKADWEFLTPSWSAALSLLADSSFLGKVLSFDPDKVNEETVELIGAYVDLPYFSPEVAGKAANAAEGLATWVAAMKDYYYASKIVKPKLEAVAIAEAELEVAQRNLSAAQAEEAAVQARLAELQAKFDEAMADKQEKEDRCAKLQAKMEQAEALINGLSGERVRWAEDSKTFADTKSRLVGDVAVACAFMSYLGPFNSTFRSYLLDQKFIADLRARDVPVSVGLDVIDFLTTVTEIGDWNVSGLPTDPLSVQNGILVTRAERYPLLVDPQGQAFTWITNKERAADALPEPGVTALNSAKLKDTLEFCMSEGKAFVVIGVQEELDPLLDPILEKQIIQKTKTRKVVRIADNEVDLDDNFRMYFLTRLPNPHFSPELQAKTTVVDFTVTMKGLEDQLLGIVIKREQRALEEQLEQVLAEVNSNRKALAALDASLLAKLSAGGGNLLEEEGLVEMLAETKSKAAEVSTKLERAEETRSNIAEQREQYRPVATRGSVLYFSIVDMSGVNVMYQTSLAQFVELFHQSISDAPKSKLTNKRVENVIETMTYVVYRYVNKGLYEQHKLLYTFLVTVKILVRAKKLEQGDIALFLRGGAALTDEMATAGGRKPPKWMPSEAWRNVVALTEGSAFFRALADNISRSEPQWLEWYESNEPENLPVPDYESPIRDNADTGAWYRLQIVRALRVDRTLLAIRDFVRHIPDMGERYVEPVTDTIDEIYATMDAHTPVIYLLSTGADPTEAIQHLAKKKKNTVSCISMGEGQEVRAKSDIRAGSVGGSWVLLQNCELGLDLMDEMEDMIKDMKDTVHPDFRLFITALPHKSFPLGLLQMSTKVTNEPPNGLRAGLFRSYTVMVDQDRLERIDTPSQAPMWRRLLFSLCFLHSIVQERRKFGPLGWCVPYEYNSGDLSACILFLERHLYAGPISWPTLQYMVCEVQYGGRITDDLDRRLFNAYGVDWVSKSVLEDGYSFAPAKPLQPFPSGFTYALLDANDVLKYREYASSFPDIDSPEIFGLHPNADLTFRTKEVREMLDTMSETQPRDTGGGGKGKSLDETVMEKAAELLEALPEDYTEDEYTERIRRLGGLRQPLNIFLMQEIQRFQAVIGLVRHMLRQMRLAIKGDVVMTTELQDAMTDIFDARVPKSWLRTPGGDERSWLFPELGLWFSSLLERDQQFRTWLGGDVPRSFWVTGFSNPQGFLTAMKQTETRKHRREGWALDEVDYFSLVTGFDRAEAVHEPPESGVYIHGLFLDGARWDKRANSLAESEPKKLFAPMPIIHITATSSRGDTLRRMEEEAYKPNPPVKVPMYRYMVRTDVFLVMLVKLRTINGSSRHWVLRGVAILCVTTS